MESYGFIASCATITQAVGHDSRTRDGDWMVLCSYLATTCASLTGNSYLWVQGSYDVGEVFPSFRCVILKRVLSDVPSRAVQLVQSGENILDKGGREREGGGKEEGKVGGRGRSVCVCVCVGGGGGGREEGVGGKGKM